MMSGGQQERIVKAMRRSGGSGEGHGCGGDRRCRGGKVVQGFEGEQEYFEGDAVTDGEPVESVEDRSDVAVGGGFGDDPGCSILDKLQFMEGFDWETGEEGVAVVQTGCHQGVNEDGC